ncbi:MAG: ABC transporter permease [Gammaproteobacteria bacterium 39-13]|mgnify:CR=1 FL=1|nr:ABC transporter permease [Gammaproteobacteria bacterium]OJV96004.1 MAG: ABC transporter permease [Gammaproteobacteria bacterium 39-13]
MNLLQLLGSIEIGLIYALIALGVYISFRIIDFPDLTVDGSFTLGASVAAALISSGYPALPSTLIAILAGMLAGMATGYLNVKWNILGLLSGILTMTALYSINLRIMGKPNIAIINDPTLFTQHSVIVLSAIIVIITFLVLAWFFSTEFGLSMRAIGINPRVSSAYGIKVGTMKIIALALSNGIVAFGGALFAQSQGFADISMGTGTIIVGLASVMIGESLLGPKKIIFALAACIIGSLLYRIAIAFALNIHDIGLQASDLNLLTACLVTMTMILPKLKTTLERRL